LGVWHLLFQDDFFYNAAAVIAPIPLLVFIIMLAAREPMKTGGA
jgi:hypothetical protein